VCGRFWFDSDGGPCHDVCGHCGKMYDVDDGSQCDCTKEEGLEWCHFCGEYKKFSKGKCERCGAKEIK